MVEVAHDLCAHGEMGWEMREMGEMGEMGSA
jgi:hypothetical protein